MSRANDVPDYGKDFYLWHPLQRKVYVSYLTDGGICHRDEDGCPDYDGCSIEGDYEEDFDKVDELRRCGYLWRPYVKIR